MKWLVRLVVRLVRDTDGQDLVEYGLLALFVGLAGAATFDVIVATLATLYRAFDTGIQALWEPPDP
jgi:Flp pilus assembly pilin Flp